MPELRLNGLEVTRSGNLIDDLLDGVYLEAEPGRGGGRLRSPSRMITAF